MDPGMWTQPADCRAYGRASLRAQKIGAGALDVDFWSCNDIGGPPLGSFDPSQAATLEQPTDCRNLTGDVVVDGLGVRDLKSSRDALWREDRRFWRGATQLDRAGWPAHRRRGLVYELETTRLLLAPPAGVFPAPYPVWMAAWPRAGPFTVTFRVPPVS
jgi:hypothetical protein